MYALRNVATDLGRRAVFLRRRAQTQMFGPLGSWRDGYYLVTIAWRQLRTAARLWESRRTVLRAIRGDL